MHSPTTTSPSVSRVSSSPQVLTLSPTRSWCYLGLRSRESFVFSNVLNTVVISLGSRIRRICMEILFEDPVEMDASHTSSCHAVPDSSPETVPILRQILRSILVQWVTCIWLEEQKLHSYDRRVQVQYWLPFFSEDVQTHVALQIDVWVVDLLRALYFRWLVRIVLAHVEGEVKDAAFVDTLVRRDGKVER